MSLIKAYESETRFNTIIFLHGLSFWRYGNRGSLMSVWQFGFVPNAVTDTVTVVLLIAATSVLWFY